MQLVFVYEPLAAGKYAVSKLLSEFTGLPQSSSSGFARRQAGDP
jgi:hypothetical protein